LYPRQIIRFVREELPQRLVLVGGGVGVAHLQAECGVFKLVKELPELRARLDELAQPSSFG
jgi:hypothetical protein